MCASNVVLGQEEEIRIIDGRGEEVPTREDVVRAIFSLKNYKTPGDDNIPAELVKHGKPNFITGSIVTVPIYMKSIRLELECINYRGIAALDAGSCFE